MNNKVVIGLSGGVDSSVAAYLLKKQGYEVIGVTIKTLNNTDTVAFENQIEDARKVANKLGISFNVLDFTECFKEKVIDYFTKEYTKARTPNPCIVCNRFVKWQALLDYATSIGAYYIATGHYARITKLDNGRYAIKNSINANKDQTYALYMLNQEQLQRTLMIIGDYSKDEIRKIASDIGLEVANKPDSMEICFIPDGDYASFIEKQISYKLPCGNFVDKNGNVLGKHKGIINYTIGQRKGLGLSLGKPGFVTKIDAETNEVIIGDNEDLMTDTVYAKNINLMGIEKITDGMEAVAKIRYNHNGSACRLYMEDENTIKCVFYEKQRASTPGQALVIYKDDYVLGGGTIL